jgi:hypothetical protein
MAMKFPAAAPFPRDEFPADELLRLELKIARRADELSRSAPPDPISDREHWVQAERDVLGWEVDLVAGQ